MKIESAALSELMLDLAAFLYGEGLFNRRKLMEATETEVRRLGLWTTEDDVLSGSVGIKSRGLASIDFRFSDLARTGSLISERRNSWRVAPNELAQIRGKTNADASDTASVETVTISAIRPQSKQLVYNLVTEAGVDTSDWGQRTGSCLDS